ncbi:BadF/BadG/BcrA/BcrD ATPase family protein, partial [Elusimicrobiota bacterium]
MRKVPRTSPLSLGLDIGSVNLHAALLDGSGEPVGTLSIPLRGDPLHALREALEQISHAASDNPVSVAATGRGRELLEPVPGVLMENEITAGCLAAGKLAPGALSIVEVGGHFSKWMLFDEEGGVRDYSLNELCAAGSGAFLEQQASRLRLTPEAVSSPYRNLATGFPVSLDMAAGATAGATIAGRCSVFAKSDMIHLQQKGTPTDEIAYGLCLALARNYTSTVLKGRDLVRPLA